MMHGRPILTRSVITLVATMALTWLAGCQGMYLHNAGRAAVAAGAKKNVDSVDVASITKTEGENLTKLLEEEVKSIETRQKLVAGLAAIQLASAEESVAYQYFRAGETMKIGLGTDSFLDLARTTECLTNKSVSQEQVDLLAERLQLQVATVPACKELAAKPVADPPGLSGAALDGFKENVKRYGEQCRMALAPCNRTVAGREAAQVDEARRELARVEGREQMLEKQLRLAKSAYDKALAENKAQAGTHSEQQIREKANSVVEVAEEALKVSPSLANKVKGSALIELLTVAAGGESHSNDPKLAPALVIAKEFPSLAAAADSALAKRGTIPVSHLLLALNDLVIQADRDARLKDLHQEEIAIAEDKLEMRNRQARLWARYSNQICNLAYPAGRFEPRSACEITFSYEVPKERKGLTCTVRMRRPAGAKPEQGRPEITEVKVSNCNLERSWRAFLTEKLDNAKPEAGSQRRATYEAAAAYLQLRLNAYQTTVDEFRRIDVLNRRTVVTREAALLQWKNLVSVPVDELNGYYEGGVKSAEMADLIVKVVGFAAIAIGLAQ